MADRIDDLLEQGFGYLETGNLPEAASCGARAVAVDSDCADAQLLVGAAAQAMGDAETARRAYRTASALDPESAEPLLRAAENECEAGQFAAALGECERALEVAEEEEDYLDALVLKAELQIELGDLPAAAETLDELPSVELPSVLHSRVGSCLIELDRLDDAERHIEAARRAAPEDPDLLYELGRIAQARGDQARQTLLFSRVRELDLAQPDSPSAIEPARFEVCIEAALAALPAPAQALLANIPVIASDVPSAALVQDGVDPRILGLFAGVPYPEQSTLGQAPHLECIYLYQRNIARDAHSVDEVEEEIRITLLHETGHFFGLDEDDLERRGLD